MPVNANLANFGVAWGLYFMWVHLRLYEWLAVLLVLLIETGWQITQAMVTCAANPCVEGDGAAYYIGGWGFNYANYIYAIGGMTLAFLIDLMQPPHIRPIGGYPPMPCEQFHEEDQISECYALLEPLLASLDEGEEMDEM